MPSIRPFSTSSYIVSNNLKNANSQIKDAERLESYLYKCSTRTPQAIHHERQLYVPAIKMLFICDNANKQHYLTPHHIPEHHQEFYLSNNRYFREIEFSEQKRTAIDFISKTAIPTSLARHMETSAIKLHHLSLSKNIILKRFADPDSPGLVPINKNISHLQSELITAQAALWEHIK